MKKCNKWDFNKKEYESVLIDDECLMRENDLKKIIKCPNCNKEFQCGLGYTSLKYHNDFGLGYIVCKDCYEKELKESGRNDAYEIVSGKPGDIYVTGTVSDDILSRTILDNYKWHLSAIKCNRFYSDFMRACDLGVEDVGINVDISFVTDKKPTKKNVEKIIKIFEKTKEEKSLEAYFTNVKFVRAEIIIGDDDAK